MANQGGTVTPGGDVTILLGDGIGNFTAAPTSPENTGNAFVAVGDFNGDSRPDLAVTNQISNDVTILLAHVPECSDGADNDGDGKTDFGTGPNNDPGCTSATDDDETDPPPPPKQCADGQDNDNDGKTDFGQTAQNDAGCDSASDDSEAGEARAPAARNNSYATDEDRTLHVPAPGVLGNDSDPDGDPLTAERVSGPAHGTLTLRPNGSFTYDPDRDYNGSDSFTYRACDDGSPRKCDSATVNITVRAVADGGSPPRCTISRGSGNDIIRGTPGPDVICAGAGNDIVYGLGGNDIIRGGPGSDILRGDDGSDRLEGGEGNDRLIGGSGADTLSGQDGRDSLEARDGVRGNDAANGGSGSDTCSRDPGDKRTSC
ncbi:MAG: cadherin-like domain-containing protein [Solirubrobacterales bacterium]|nr:cadherin-like domain-containing protein [Solirubrobacterales bacterium]